MIEPEPEASTVTFRELTEADFGLLADWLGRAHVQEWWRDSSAPAAVAKKYGRRIRGEEPTEVFVVGVDGADVGMIQRYRIRDHPEWLETLAGAGVDASEAAGIDYLLGDPAVVGRGVGSEMIRSFTGKLFADYKDVISVVVTPQAANAASCRVLEKAGYEQRWIGVLESDDPADDGTAVLYRKIRPKG